MEQNAPQSAPIITATRAQNEYKAGYSRTIRALRLALPIIAIILVTVVLIWPNLDKSQNFTIEQSATPTIANATNELLNPRFESVDKDGNPYSILAERAEQSPDSANTVLLKKPTGDIALKNDAAISVTADNGEYAQDDGKLVLQNNVNVVHSEGYQLVTDTLHLGFKNNVIWSENDVRIEGEMGTINAKGVTADGEKGTVIFNGPASITLNQNNTGLETVFENGLGTP